MSIAKPYYERDGITLFHADCLEVLATLEPGSVDAVVTDPPYGISYSSGMTGHDGGEALPGIVGDESTALRDEILKWSGCLAAIVFGSSKVARPDNVRAVLIWEKGDHVGMGDLSLPWKPNTEEIYVIGKGFHGHRGSSVLKYNAPVSWNSVGFGRVHSHQKPVPLLEDLIGKCPQGTVLDPFAGSCTTGVAAWNLGRRAILCEIEEKYCEIGAKRLDRVISQRRLFVPAVVQDAQKELFDDDADRPQEVDR